MELGSWPSVTNDPGDKQSGTVWTKEIHDGIKTSVEGNVHSAANPTVATKTIIDEVVDARGSKTSLDARLDVALEEDGTPKAVAGQATEEQVRAQVAQKNLLANGDLELWTAGTTSAPDNFTLSGAAAAILKSGPAQADTTDLGVGTYSARITSGGGEAAKLTQIAISVANMSRWRNVQGKKIALAVRVKTSTSNTVRIVVDDGVTTTVSGYNTTTSAEEDLAVVHLLDSAATKLDVYAEVALGGLVAYVGGFSLSFSDLTIRWQVGDKTTTPSQAIVTGTTTTVNIGGRLSTNVVDVGNVGAGEDDLMTYALPAGILSTDGQVVRVTAWGTMAVNGNTKLVRAYFGATGILLTIAGHAPSDARWRAQFEIIRTGAAAQILIGHLVERDVASSSFVFTPAEATPAETLANSITIKMTGEATSNNDIVQKGMIVEVLP